jgi:hypothetical protein
MAVVLIEANLLDNVQVCFCPNQPEQKRQVYVRVAPPPAAKLFLKLALKNSSYYIVYNYQQSIFYF